MADSALDSVILANSLRKASSSSSSSTMVVCASARGPSVGLSGVCIWVSASGACIEVCRPFWDSMESKTSIISGEAGACGGVWGCCVRLSKTRGGGGSRARAGVGEFRYSRGRTFPGFGIVPGLAKFFEKNWGPLSAGAAWGVWVASSDAFRLLLGWGSILRWWYGCEGA